MNKKWMVLVFIGLLWSELAGQTTFNSSPAVGTYAVCPASNLYGACVNQNFLGNTAQMTLYQVTSTQFVFRIKKCSGTFSQSGTGYIKDQTNGGVCGVVLGSQSFNSGTSFTTVTIPIPSGFLNGSRDFYGTITSNSGERFWSGKITITASTPLPDLRMNSSISISPSSPVQGQAASFQATVKNFGSGIFSGNIVMQLLDANQGYLTDLDIDNNVTIGAGNTYNLSFSTGAITSNPGAYHIRIQYQQTGGSWTTVSSGGYQNPKPFTILAAVFSLNLNSVISITPSAPVQGQSASFQVSITNTGTATFSGTLVMQLLNSNQGYLTDLDIDNNIQLAPGAVRTLSFNTAAITSSPGTYHIRIQYFTAGGSWTTVGAGGFQNPRQFTIQSSTANLYLSSAMSFGAGNLVAGNPYTFSTTIHNGGNTLWSGSIYLKVNAVFPSEDLNSVDIPANGSVQVTYTFIPTAGHVGTSVPAELYFQTNGQGNSLRVGAGNFTNPVYINISNSTGSLLRLGSAMSFGTNNLTVGSNYNFTTNIQNTGNTSWAGSLYLKINNISPSEDLGSFTIPAGGIAAVNYGLTPGSNHAGSNVPAQLYYQTGGQGNSASLAAGNFANPITVNITNPGGFILSLAASASFNNSNMTVGNAYTYTVNIRNTGGSSWTGGVFLQVNGVLPMLSLGTHTLASQENKIITYAFTPTIVYAGSNVPAQAFYQTNNQGNYLSIPTGGFSNPIYVNIAPPASNCNTFTDLPANGDGYNAARCLCELGYVTPQNYGGANTNGVNPASTMYRADLAKVVYFLLYRGNQPAPSDNYPVPFLDLQSNASPLVPNDPYYKYAKALCYLEYSNAVAPFDRNFDNFRPYDGITRKYALKVILEALNIQPDNSGPSPCPDIQPGNDAYGYVKKAWQMGLITQCNPDALITRQEVFIILHRILNYDNQLCNPDNALIPTPTANDYFIPGNFSPYNMARQSGYAEGYFPSYTKTSFNISGRGPDLVFSHLYNSKLTELPEAFMPVQPLGVGWSHAYNAYILEAGGWTEGGATQAAKLLIFWPDGGIHVYDKNTLDGETVGVYDVLASINATTYQIKTKKQVRFTFSRFGSGTSSSPYIWMLTSIKDRNNNEMVISYQVQSNKPRITQVTDPAGRKLAFNYQAGDAKNYIRSIQDLSGGRSIFFYYTDDNLTGYKNPKGDNTTYGYSPNPDLHLLSTITLPEGNVVTNVYNTNRKLQSTRVGSAQPTTIGLAANNFANNDQFFTSTVTDPANDVFNHNFNDNGQLKQLSSGGNTVNATYGDPGNPSLATDFSYNGFEVGYEYDAMGNVKTVTMPTGLTHRFTYTALNDIATYTDPKGYQVKYFYDGAGNVDYVEDAMGYISDLSFNQQGLVSAMEGPTDIVYSFGYDDFGNMKSINGPLGISASFDYDDIGRLRETRNPNNQVTKMDYDNHDNLTHITAIVPTGNVVTQYVYDKNDLLREVINARNFKTVLNYDTRDLLRTVTFGDDKESYDYRNDNLLDKITKPDNSVFQFSYDALGRVENDGYAAYTYDNQDNILTITAENKTLECTYDALNRLATVTYDGKMLTYQYDNNGNRTRIIYPGNSLVINYEYNANNWLTKVKEGNTLLAEYFYRPDGLPDSTRYQNGTYTVYEYDAAGRNIGMATKKANGAVICAYEFELDAIGNHRQELVTEPFAAPALPGQTLSSNFNGENEVGNLGGTTYAFDKDGNQTKGNSGTFTWNSVDQLTGIGSSKTFAYDGLGFLRTATRGGQITKYVWDLLGIGNLLMETDNAGNPINYYVYGQGLICRIKAAGGQKHFYHSDFRGSTIAMTDAAGSITHQYQYDPYGLVLQKTETDPNPFQFIGAYGVLYEGDSLYYMRARYYDATTGRFLSEDPVWSVNLYAYAGGNPVGGIDPTGRFTWMDGMMTVGEVVMEVVKSKLGDLPGLGWSIFGLIVTAGDIAIALEEGDKRGAFKYVDKII